MKAATDNSPLTTIDPPSPALRTTPDASTSPVWTPAEFALIGLLLLAALGLRWWRGPEMSPVFAGIATMTTPGSNLHTDPPSLDEVWHLALSTGRGSPMHAFPRDVLLKDVPAWTSLAGAPPWWKVWTSLDGVAHPPLYLVTLRWWRAAFGEGDLVAIAYSIAWSGVALVFTYLAARLALGRAVAFWAAAIFAIGPVPIYFSLEIRGYSMLVGLCSLATYFLVRLARLGTTWPNVVGLCAAMLACVLTHYFAVPACAAAGVYALIAARDRWRRVLIGGVVTAAIVLLAWGPFFLRQVQPSLADTNYLFRDGRQPLATLIAAVSLPVRLIVEVPIGTKSFALPGLALLTLGIVAGVRRRELRPFLAWGFGLIGFLLITDLARNTQQLNFIRYAAAAMPLAAVLAPGAIASLTRLDWPTHVAGFAMVAIGLWNQSALIRGEVLTFTSAVQPVLPRVQPEQTLLLYFDYHLPQVEMTTDAMLLEWARMPGVFPRDAAILYSPASPEFRRELRTKQVWLIGMSHCDPTKIVPGSRIRRRVDFWPTTKQFNDPARQLLAHSAWLLELDPLPILAGPS